jgi:hypothetical protein
MSLQCGRPGRIEDRVFRIGHMGDLAVLSLTGALTGGDMDCARPVSRTGKAAFRPR